MKSRFPLEKSTRRRLDAQSKERLLIFIPVGNVFFMGYADGYYATSPPSALRFEEVTEEPVQQPGLRLENAWSTPPLYRPIKCLVDYTTDRSKGRLFCDTIILRHN